MIPDIILRTRKSKKKTVGLRIRHKTLKGILLVVRDQSRPLLTTDGKPLPSNFILDDCITCGTPHDVKTYHLPLDSEGTTIVSREIFEKLRGLEDHAGFELANVVDDPPDQVLHIPLVLQPVKAFTPEPIRREHIHEN